ncbi:MAG: BamA/TamA family outer membrane protein [Candidatus Latescibacteria bacterium]|nr:BamA/TamA family outer membrane protein [Candidatus Latescibacterota bacterium]NIM64414.1 BamA/TamA family outer membrane protein [Candidatus Latescibacterota bacterium]NIO00568.1 BamA/TamA family outer membrane protein [Candidatus Latescibacterota bacterium]NIO26968.1 BamA/TamA family outer membrane protein [Candidatus Latescibacterota bacterium]NIO56045.1 BamA/TamA family outer membrane protein [Candidatus Latescibacterota bacterium]
MKKHRAHSIRFAHIILIIALMLPAPAAATASSATLIGSVAAPADDAPKEIHPFQVPLDEDPLALKLPRAQAVRLAQLLQPLPTKSPIRRVLWLEAIRVSGNKRAKEKDILRHIHLSPGDTISVSVLKKERLRLLATDYFTDVHFSTRPGSERGAVILVIEVTERSYPLIETGFGYHDLHGWFLTLIGFRFDHTFGIESRMRLGLRLGFHIAGVDAEWEKPEPPGGGFGLVARGHLYSQEHLFFGSGPDTSQSVGDWQGTDWREFKQKVNRYGGELALRYRAGRSTRFSFGIKAESVDPESTFVDRDNDLDLPFNSLPPDLQPNTDRTLITGFLFRIHRDTRDVPAFPRSGSLARLTLEANSSLLGGDEIFSKVVADYRKHIHIKNEWTISARLNGGVTSRGTPYYERFYLGGIYSIRGFRELSLSRTTGDDGFWLGSAELRWPLVASPGKPPRLTGLVFIDAGQGWKRGEVFSSDTIESAVGYGIRIRLPWLGILGIDAGIPFTDGKTGESFRVHGSLGFSF